jgi:hypothetical protein
MERKTAFGERLGNLSRARSVKEDLKKHFGVLDELSTKIDELSGMTTHTVHDGGSARY